MYRILSWLFCIFLIYEGIFHRRSGYLVASIVVTGILFVAVPQLLSLAEEETD